MNFESKIQDVIVRTLKCKKLQISSAFVVRSQSWAIPVCEYKEGRNKAEEAVYDFKWSQ